MYFYKTPVYFLMLMYNLCFLLNLSLKIKVYLKLNFYQLEALLLNLFQYIQYLYCLIVFYVIIMLL